jgi:hypothetical protein
VSHLPDDELARWCGEEPFADAARVRSHLASCDACRRRVADAIRNPPPAAPAQFDAADFVGVGYGRANGARAGQWRRVRLPLMAAAAVILAALALPIARLLAPAPVTPARVTDSASRGTAFVLDTPGGTVAAVREFRWRSPVDAPSYRIDVRDASGASVYSGTATASPLAVDPSAAARFVPGTAYQWTVTALDDRGAILVASEPLAFTMQQRR